VGDLSKKLALPMANVSHHLHALRDAGVVSARKRGRFVIYELSHVVADPRQAGTHVFDFGCVRIEFAQGRTGSSPSGREMRPEDQALMILNRVIGMAPPAASGKRGVVKRRTASKGRPRCGRALEIANPSFEEPATPFFDTNIVGWQKEGEASGTGVFRNFPDDQPLPGSRFVENAHGDQLATVAAQNPRGELGPPGLFQSLAGESYAAGASYVLTVGVGGSSVQPPTGDGRSPPSIRFALTYDDDHGKRHEVMRRNVTPAEFSEGNRLTYLSIATTLPAGGTVPCVGRRIGIHLSAADNTPGHAGHFIIDNVTLVVDAPPPRRAASRPKANTDRS
jgi:hypothetical protein